MDIVREAERPIIDRAPGIVASTVQGQKRARPPPEEEVEEPDDGGGGGPEDGALYVEEDDSEPAAKRSRVPRKLVSWIFVDMVEEGNFAGKVMCRLGCVAGPGRFVFTVSGTNTIERHVAAKHPSIFQKFELAKNNRYNLAQLEEEINSANDKTLAKLAKDKETADKFFRRTKSGSLDNKVKCDLEFLAWAVANGVSRLALNCPILDMALHTAGATPVPNRHDLAAEHLMQLDLVVKGELRRMMQQSASVCLFSDGWSDISRRFWLDLGVSFVVDSSPKQWSIEVVDVDLIPVVASSTGDVLETLIKESIDEFVPADCLIATSTNDGGGDERKAAFQLVKEGNDWWCSAHLLQLAIGDALDGTEKNPPADCEPFRALIKKAHSLVVFINGHRAVLRAFEDLSKRKREVLSYPSFFMSHGQQSEQGAKNWEQLVLDNDTRWDTELMLLERVVYFDDEILALYQLEVMRVPPDCIFTRLELDLATGMVKVLDPFRHFTKWAQLRNAVTLAYLPEKVEKLLDEISFSTIDRQLREPRPTITEPLHALQARLIAAVKARFATVFQNSSLALAARFLLPGQGRFTFRHFPSLNAENIQQVRVP